MLYEVITGNVAETYNHGTWAGVCFFSPSGVIPGYTATVDVNTRVDTVFRQYEGELVAGKTYQRDDVQVRPIVGYWFMQIDTTYDLHWQSLTLIEMKEQVSTYYNGLMAGVQLSNQEGDWDWKLETTLGLGWAHSVYSSNTDVIGSTRHDELGLLKNSLAYRYKLESYNFV